MRPRLKDVAIEHAAGQVRLARDVHARFVIDDPDGSVAKLLDLLRTGEHTTAEIAAAMALPPADVWEALDLFDGYNLVEDADRPDRLGPADRERYFSNLAFFDSFSSLGCGAEDMQIRLRDSHVLVLGAGGLNSSVIPSLCGLGVGRLTVVDRDAVEPRNFARQFLYQWADIGARKTDRAASWVRRFDPAVRVEAVELEIDGMDAIEALIDKHRPDVIAAGVDQPIEVDAWLNRACVRRRTPYVRGGMWLTQGLLWSVDPGRGPCRACPPDPDGPDPDGADPGGAGPDGAGPDGADPAGTGGTGGPIGAEIAFLTGRSATNRAIGPVAGVLGSLAAFEILRYLTRFEQPVYAHGPLVIDFARGCRMTQSQRRRSPDCLDCADCDAGPPGTVEP